MNSKKRIDVFVSSTSEDLVAYREAVRDVILAFKLSPEMMELFSAINENAVKVCLDKVSQCEVYIGIFAHRYGFCPKGSEISITEMEFNKASELQIPRFCFLVDESIEWPVKYVEGDPGKTKLVTLKNRINSTLVRRTFTSPEHLALEVAKALHPFLERPDINLSIGPYHAYDITQISQGRDEHQSDRKRVQIFIEGDVATFDKETLVNALSGMLGISKREINILQIIAGSVIIDLEIPIPAANILLALATRSKTLVDLELPDLAFIKLHSLAGVDHTDNSLDTPARSVPQIVPKLRKLMSFPLSIGGFFQQYAADWRNRRLSAKFRENFINKSAFLMSLIWIAISLVIPPIYLIVALFFIGLGSSAVATQLTLVHQRRRLQHVKAGQYEFITSMRILWGGIIGDLVLVALRAATGIAPSIPTIGGLLVILILRQVVLWTKSWVFELNPVEVAIYVPLGTRLLEHAEHRIMPPANINRKWREELLEMGINASLLDMYQQYNCPKYMEPLFISQLYDKLNDQRNRELAKQIETFIGEVRHGSISSHATLQSLVQQYQQSYEQLAKAKDRVNKSRLAAENSAENSFLFQFERLGEFFDYAVSPGVRAVPVIPIHPTEHIWVIWNKSQYIWVEMDVKSIKTSSNAMFDMHLTFAVEYEPERVWRPTMRNRQISFVWEANNELSRKSSQALGDMYFDSEGALEIMRREFERQKRNVAKVADRVTRECFTEMEFNYAISSGVSEFYGNFVKRMGFFEDSTGMRILGWSIKPMIVVPKTIVTSIEKQIAAQDQSTGSTAALRYLKMNFGNEFEEVIRYMTAGKFGESINMQSSSIEARQVLNPELPTQADTSKAIQRTPFEKRIIDEDIGYEERLRRLRSQRPNKDDS